MRVFFIFLRRWINSNFFELIHHKNTKRNERSHNAFVFENPLSVYTKKYCQYNMCVLTVVLIFRNILPCKPLLNLFFLIVWLWSSCYDPFFFKYTIFSPRFLWVVDIVRAQNFVFIFINLIQIEEKTHVAIHFHDNAFNENIHNMYCFHEWDVFLIHLFYDRHKIKEHVKLLLFR